MYIYMYVYIYVYIYTYLCIYVFIHICIYVYVFKYHSHTQHVTSAHHTSRFFIIPKPEKDSFHRVSSLAYWPARIPETAELLKPSENQQHNGSEKHWSFSWIPEQTVNRGFKGSISANERGIHPLSITNHPEGNHIIRGLVVSLYVKLSN